MREWVARYCVVCRKPGEPGETYYKWREKYYCPRHIGPFFDRAEAVLAVVHIKRRVEEKDIRDEEKEWKKWMRNTDPRHVEVVLGARDYD